MLYSFRFYVSWIASAIIMYISFYCWHGLFLTDLKQISFSLPLFLILASFVYLIISFVLYRTYESKLLNNYFHNPLFRGVISGILIGFILFAIIAVLGISFTKNVNKTYLMADCAWQIAEQIIGGVIIGLGKAIIFEPTEELHH